MPTQHSGHFMPIDIVRCKKRVRDQWNENIRFFNFRLDDGVPVVSWLDTSIVPKVELIKISNGLQMHKQLFEGTMITVRIGDEALSRRRHG